MLDTITQATQGSEGLGLSSLVMIASALIALVGRLLLGRGRRRERRESTERMLELQRQATEFEQRAARAEGTVRVLWATVILLCAVLTMTVWLGT